MDKSFAPLFYAALERLNRFASNGEAPALRVETRGPDDTNGDASVTRPKLFGPFARFALAAVALDGAGVGVIPAIVLAQPAVHLFEQALFKVKNAALARGTRPELSIQYRGSEQAGDQASADVPSPPGPTIGVFQKFVTQMAALKVKGASFIPDLVNGKDLKESGFDRVEPYLNPLADNPVEPNTRASVQLPSDYIDFTDVPAQADTVLPGFESGLDQPAENVGLYPMSFAPESSVFIARLMAMQATSAPVLHVELRAASGSTEPSPFVGEAVSMSQQSKPAASVQDPATLGRFAKFALASITIASVAGTLFLTKDIGNDLYQHLQSDHVMQAERAIVDQVNGVQTLVANASQPGTLLKEYVETPDNAFSQAPQAPVVAAASVLKEWVEDSAKPVDSAMAPYKPQSHPFLPAFVEKPASTVFEGDKGIAGSPLEVMVDGLKQLQEFIKFPEAAAALPVAPVAKHKLQPFEPAPPISPAKIAVEEVPPIAAPAEPVKPPSVLRGVTQTDVYGVRMLPVKFQGKSLHTVHPADRIALAKQAASDQQLNKQFGPDAWKLVYGVITAESNWMPRDGMGLNKRASVGIAQMEAPTARALGIDPLNPHQAAVGVAKLIQEAGNAFRERVRSGMVVKDEAGKKLGKVDAAITYLSVHYNTSSSWRNEWDGSLATLAKPTRHHVSNLRYGMGEAASVDRQVKTLTPEEHDKRIARQIGIETQAIVAKVNAAAATAMMPLTVKPMVVAGVDRATVSTAFDHLQVQDAIASRKPAESMTTAPISLPNDMVAARKVVDEAIAKNFFDSMGSLREINVAKQQLAQAKQALTAFDDQSFLATKSPAARESLVLAVQAAEVGFKAKREEEGNKVSTSSDQLRNLEAAFKQMQTNAVALASQKSQAPVAATKVSQPPRKVPAAAAVKAPVLSPDQTPAGKDLVASSHLGEETPTPAPLPARVYAQPDPEPNESEADTPGM